jgi:hypothetical protein
MNDLGSRILQVLEGSPLGDMSVFVLTKQSADMGINLDSMSKKDIPPLVDRLGEVLPFFLGESTNNVLINIRRISESEMTVI